MNKINYVSDYLRTPQKGHEFYDFVDLYLNSDNPLFIDPCLIEFSKDPWCINAQIIICCFFDSLFNAFRNNDFSQVRELLSHGNECNALKLGYGNGYNGKGKTSLGLWKSLEGLYALTNKIQTINCAQDLPILVKDFAEDCMSDLLANILHEQLNSFTASQMSKWNCPSQTELSFWTFDIASKAWIKVTKPSWLYNDKELLLVPKNIVRHTYLFKAHQYLKGIIVERMRTERDLPDIKKIDIWKSLPRNTKNWEYDIVINYTTMYPDALIEYHKKFLYYYNRKNGRMTDEQLDRRIYKIAA